MATQIGKTWELSLWAPFSGAHIRQIPQSTQRGCSGIRRSPKMCQELLSKFQLQLGAMPWQQLFPKGSPKSGPTLPSVKTLIYRQTFGAQQRYDGYDGKFVPFFSLLRIRDRIKTEIQTKRKKTNKKQKNDLLF